MGLVSSPSYPGRIWPHKEAQRCHLLRTSEQHFGRSAREMGSSEPELAGPFEFPALPSVVSRTADDEQYHGARRWPEYEQAS